MRHGWRPGFGLCVGIGIMAGAAALGLADRTANAAPSPGSLSEPAALEEQDPYEEEDTEQQDATLPQMDELEASPTPYTLAPLTGQPGPTWSPEIGGAPMTSMLRSRPQQGQSYPQRGFGAGIYPQRGAQPFELGPLPGTGAGAPSTR